MNSQLFAILNHAERYYGLAPNPVKNAGSIGEKHAGEMQIWSKEEYLRFSESLIHDKTAFPAFELLYWTGIREGEMLALTSADFDFEGIWLDINKSFSRREGQNVIGPPKTKKSRRRIAISKFLA